MRRMTDARRRRSRRRFLKTVPAAVAGTVALPSLAASESSVSRDAIACAENVSGVPFSPAERELMEPLVSANRDHYETLRQVAVGYEVEPAFSFRPLRKTP